MIKERPCVLYLQWIRISVGVIHGVLPVCEARCTSQVWM